MYTVYTKEEVNNVNHNIKQFAMVALCYNKVGGSDIVMNLYNTIRSLRQLERISLSKVPYSEVITDLRKYAN